MASFRVKALEAVWGIELEPLTDAVVRIPRPWGFVVAERRIRRRGGDWAVYWVRKEGVSSLQAARAVKEAVGGWDWKVLGLKDTDAVAYQYVLVNDPRDPKPLVEAPEVRAWLVGWDRRRTMGSHQWNSFRLELEPVRGAPEAVCEAAGSLRWVPGFYGPQRFGVWRPDSHLQGLYMQFGAFGWLAREYEYSYEPRGAPGGYEARALEAAGRHGPWVVSLFWEAPRELLAEAVQSYVWNRALSIALREGLEEYAGRRTRAHCEEERQAVIARLPSRGLLRGTSRWAGLVSWVVEEEGLPAWVLPLRAPRRPLAVEPCRLSCMVRGGRVVLWVALPRGLYATVAVRTLAYVDWLSS